MMADEASGMLRPPHQLGASPYLRQRSAPCLVSTMGGEVGDSGAYLSRAMSAHERECACAKCHDVWGGTRVCPACTPGTMVVCSCRDRMLIGGSSTGRGECCGCHEVGRAAKRKSRRRLTPMDPAEGEMGCGLGQGGRVRPDSETDALNGQQGPPVCPQQGLFFTQGQKQAHARCALGEPFDASDPSSVLQIPTSRQAEDSGFLSTLVREFGGSRDEMRAKLQDKGSPMTPVQRTLSPRTAEGTPGMGQLPSSLHHSEEDGLLGRSESSTSGTSSIHDVPAQTGDVARLSDAKGKRTLKTPGALGVCPWHTREQGGDLSGQPTSPGAPGVSHWHPQGLGGGGAGEPTSPEANMKRVTVCPGAPRKPLPCVQQPPSARLQGLMRQLF